jgi:hypothetical protein
VQLTAQFQVSRVAVAGPSCQAENSRSVGRLHDRQATHGWDQGEGGQWLRVGNESCGGPSNCSHARFSRSGRGPNSQDARGPPVVPHRFWAPANGSPFCAGPFIVRDAGEKEQWRAAWRRWYLRLRCGGLAAACADTQSL